MKICPNCGHEMLNDNLAECPKCKFNLYSYEKKNNNLLSNINKKLPKAVGDIGEQITTQVKKEESYIKTRLNDDNTALVDENEFFISKTVFDGIDYITNKDGFIVSTIDDYEGFQLVGVVRGKMGYLGIVKISDIARFHGYEGFNSVEEYIKSCEGK